MDATNANTALASALVEELARCGVRHAVLSPGSRSTPLALALLREPRIEAFPIVDERSAAYFALGAANATARPAAIVCTSGTAAANLHPAVCEADEAGVPLLVLTCDRPPELRAVGAGQTIDQLKLYGSAVRWFCELGVQQADDAGLLHYRASACRAFALAAGEPRPGPVHLNVPWREPLGPAPVEDAVAASSALALEGRGELPLTDVRRPPARPDTAMLEDLAAELREARRGLIVAGLQRDPRLAPALVELSRVTGYPVLAEPTSQARCGAHDLARVVWAYDAIARVRPEALEPQLVLRFGELPTSKALRAWLAGLDSCTQFVVDPAGGWSEPTRKAASILRADPVALARDLATTLVGRTSPDGTWHELWRRADSAAAREIETELRAFVGEPTEPALHRALGDAYRDGELVYTASSMPIRDQESFLPASRTELLFCSNRGANGIDGTVSAGIGAAAASGRPTWIVLGDLALHHDANGLAALRHTATPVRLVVVDNDGGGIFEFLPQAGEVSREEFEAIFGTPLGLDSERLAALHGVEHHSITDVAELTALPRDRHLLAAVEVDRQSNVAIHRALWESAARGVHGALDGRSDP